MIAPTLTRQPSTDEPELSMPDSDCKLPPVRTMLQPKARREEYYHLLLTKTFGLIVNETHHSKWLNCPAPLFKYGNIQLGEQGNR